MFRAGLDDALVYLPTKAQLTYGDFFPRWQWANDVIDSHRALLSRRFLD